MVKAVNTALMRSDIPTSSPVDLTADLTDTLPGGALDPRTTLWCNQKLDVAFYDGNGNWYREADKPIAAGQLVSALFE